jgi:hypothetical protein
MANTVIAIRSSGVASNVPDVGSLANGEIALNFADGILYYKTDTGTLGTIQAAQPGGLDTEVQFNDTGSFGGDSGFTYNKTTDVLTVAGGVVSGGVNLTPTLASSFDHANAAFDGANSSAKLSFTTITANGTSIVADSNADTLSITSNTANGIFINGNATTDTIDLGLLSSGVTPGTYGNSSTILTLTIDQFGRITQVTSNTVTAVETDPFALAFAIALG